MRVARSPRLLRPVDFDDVSGLSPSSAAAVSRTRTTCRQLPQRINTSSVAFYLRFCSIFCSHHGEEHQEQAAEAAANTKA